MHQGQQDHSTLSLWVRLQDRKGAQIIRYIVGIDGGGSKTNLEVRFFDSLNSPCDILNKEKMNFKSGPLNVKNIASGSLNEAVLSMLNFLEGLEGGLKPCEMIVVGTAGASNPEIVENIRKAFSGNGYSGKLVIVGDDITALKGGLSGRSGAVLISGTGSICNGIDSKGHSLRSGGWGYLIDDVGSGYAIGRDILSQVVRENDGRSEKSVLTELVYERLNISSIPELIAYVYSENTGKNDIAALAPLIAEGMAKGDKASMDICDKAVSELCSLAEAVIKGLDSKNPELMLSGSILTKLLPVRERFIKAFKSRNENVKISEPEHSAETGAVLIGAEMILQEGNLLENNS